MIEEYGVVERTGPDRVQIRIMVPGGCDECPVRENCYRSGEFLEIPVGQVKGVPTADLQPRSRVRLEIGRITHLGMTALIYGVPLLSLLLGLVLGYYGLFSWAPDRTRAFLSFLTGAAMVSIAGLFVRWLDRRHHDRLEYRIELL